MASFKLAGKKLNKIGRSPCYSSIFISIYENGLQSIENVTYFIRVKGHNDDSGDDHFSAKRL